MKVYYPRAHVNCMHPLSSVVLASRLLATIVVVVVVSRRHQLAVLALLLLSSAGVSKMKKKYRQRRLDPCQSRTISSGARSSGGQYCRPTNGGERQSVGQAGGIKTARTGNSVQVHRLRSLNRFAPPVSIQIDRYGSSVFLMKSARDLTGCRGLEIRGKCCITDLLCTCTT